MKSTIESRGMIVMRKDSVAEYGQVYFLKCKRKTQTIRQRQAIRQRQTKSQKRHTKKNKCAAVKRINGFSVPGQVYSL